MLCYGDTTFCSSDGCQNKCGRKLTKEVEHEAQKFWLKTFNNTGVVYSFGTFCDENGELLLK